MGEEEMSDEKGFSEGKKERRNYQNKAGDPRVTVDDRKEAFAVFKEDDEDDEEGAAHDPASYHVREPVHA